MIRAATLSDLPTIVSLARELHDESNYRDFVFDESYITENIKKIFNSGVIFLAVKDDEIIGGFMGGVTSLWYTPDKVGFDYSFFIKKEHRQGITALKLLYAFEHWARSQGAKYIQLGITTGISTEGTACFYEHMGYEWQGPQYQKRIL